MIQETNPAADYQNHIVDSENPKQGQDSGQGNLKNGTCDTNLHHDDNLLRRTEPMTFLEDLDKDIGRRFPKANQGQSPDQAQPFNAGERLEKNCSDLSGNADKNEAFHNNTTLKIRDSNNKGGKMSNDSVDTVESNEKRNTCKLVSAQTNIPRTSVYSNLESQKPCLKQVSTSKIPKPVRSQKSNIGIQQPGSKATHSCRTVPVLDRNFKRQRQSSVGPGGSSGILKHPQTSPKDGKRNENDLELHRSRIKPSQSSPIRKSEALDVIFPAKKGAGETGARSENEENELFLGDLENNENKSLENRNDFLIWLSKAISETRLNTCKLDECFTNYKSTFASINDSGKEPHATKELEVLQKLIKKVSDLYEQCQSEKIANIKLQANLELAHNTDQKKIGLLESENHDLVTNMDNLGKRLEEEKANNDKLKRGSQTIPSIKKKIRDVEQRLKTWDDKQRDQIQKMKNLETNCKLKNLDNIEKELKETTTVHEKLMQENENLKKELQKSQDQHNSKLSKMIDDSEEMKGIREQLTILRSKYNEELNRGKKYLAEQQQTSLKLKEMEVRSKNLSQLIEEAKKEIKTKNHEFEDFKKTVELDKQMMKTELDACKVTKQGTLDENAMLRAKIESLHSKNDRVHSLEKESIEIEQQLRTDLALRDEQIMQLQEQIKSLLMERKYKDVTSNKMKNRTSLDQCQIIHQERANLAAQILDLQKNVDELANNNLDLQKLLADRNAELEQRDQIVKLQTDVLKIRDELIELLRNKDSKHEKHVEELSSILMEREHAIEKEWKNKVEKLQESNSNVSSNHTKFQQFSTSHSNDQSIREGSNEEKLSLKDLHLMFQNKELDLDSMQERIKALEKIHQNFSQQRIRQEDRMRTLEESLEEKSSHTWIPVLVK